MLAPGKLFPGTSLRITVNFVDEDGSAVDPTTVTFSTYNPCRTKTDYVYDTDAEVGRSAAGAYYADIEPDIAGRWHYRWKTTGSGTTIAKEGNFVIQDSKFVDSCCEDYA